MKTLILIITSAVSLYGQEAVTAPAKPAYSNIAGKPEASKPEITPSLGVSLSTARIWRLNSKVQALQSQLEATEQGKALKEAQAELQAEQAALSAKCTAVGMVLDYDRNPSSATKDDLTCVKPKEPEAKK